MGNQENQESDNESNHPPAARAESRSSDRRGFMKAAVAGAAVAGIAATAGKAEAGGVCTGIVTVPRALVKGRVLFNNQLQITRQTIDDVLSRIFNASACPTCGLAGFLNGNPGVVTELRLETAYLEPNQQFSVIFSNASVGG